MAGHSKWKQIKHYKAAADAKRGAMFTKLIREITVAAKAGGGDPAGNPRLRTAIEAARAASMPKDNIERAIKKGTGELEGVDYQEVMYEGYGPGGVALLIQALTDNPTRTVAEVRHKLSRGGGNLGATNSVAWMFERKGQIYVDASRYDEDAALEAALEAGARAVRATAARAWFASLALPAGLRTPLDRLCGTAVEGDRERAGAALASVLAAAKRHLDAASVAELERVVQALQGSERQEPPRLATAGGTRIFE